MFECNNEVPKLVAEKVLKQGVRPEPETRTLNP